jgi:mono/diheme cytochrome c family protein
MIPKRHHLRPSKRWLSVMMGVVAFGIVNEAHSDELPRQLFGQHCQKCHEGAKPKGEFKIDSLSDDFSDKTNRAQWLAVLEQLKSGEMPPEEKPRPPARETQAVVDWISKQASTRQAEHGRVVLGRL